MPLFVGGVHLGTRDGFVEVHEMPVEFGTVYAGVAHLSANGIPPLDAYVIDDGWNDYKAPFWSINKKY